MNTHWMLNTNGDPSGAVHRFLRDLWPAADLRALVVPPAAPGERRLLTDPSRLDEVDIFQPLMLMNLAKAIPEVLKEYPDGRVGILLRPCELRALTEMARRGAFSTDRLLTICVDCPGTFPEDEFEWRSARSKSGLTDEALQFAPQGGIAAYRYRSACQMCISPGATEADVNIGVLGLPVHETLLVDAKDSRVDWARLTGGPADPALVKRRESMLAKLTERHTQRRERIIRELTASLPADVDALLDQFEHCAACGACMDACPICSVTRPRPVEGRFRREDVVGWLASCAGCGMCEQSCPQHLPLNAIFAKVREKVEEA
ncbi:MAG: formate dehydrogenase beta subunit [Anaerolineaceae bacterium]|nr:MAG: formate dehydrogenase beta subunit [Anaerolineaceae bacterium]